MKVQQILSSVCLIALVLPMAANAEVYKWKGKNGVTVYSDTPPPANVKARSFGKTGKDTAVRPEPSSAAAAEEGKVKAAAGQEDDGKTAPIEDPKLQAKRVMARQAEFDKKQKQEKAENAKIYAENCKAAKANYQQFSQGGRVYKVNEKGEREYMDDAGLAVGKVRAQAEMQKYCK